MIKLKELRKEIDTIDEELLKLVSRRLRISKEIGKFKRKYAQGIKDNRREKEVKVHWISSSQKYNLPVRLTEQILTQLLTFSRISQVQASKHRNVTIFGYGSMSKSIASLLSFAGHNVVLTGINLKEAMKVASEINVRALYIKDALDLSEYLILAIPPTAVNSKTVLQVLKSSSRKLVMDIFSSKEKAFLTMEKLSIKYGFTYVSTHPLFGPIYLPIGERIVIIPSSTGVKVVNEVKKFWLESGLIPIVSSLEDHEKAMAIVQVLVHFYLVGLLRSINVSKKKLNINTCKFATYNFVEVSKILERTRSNIKVIFEIQKYNKYSKSERALGLNELLKLKKELDKQ
ncbi:MAG: prephenate dehydrogenase/arogenate dehydrogenase family protein [Thermoproteota archaeon]|nr:bifunctional chorismate mutase/prephenate dehydrogenase [Candidatus Brockarchaeota archaeon]MBO3767853.1 bifunctional chorismate mutase/prephenate dehydrogenase [Candidatus Brockarchaeota archaeon]MBO3801623.1 bifunctional chorismate mutase/prephenate dehydrogenase [Candidatus Brockarchaeota archaeon]